MSGASSKQVVLILNKGLDDPDFETLHTIENLTQLYVSGSSETPALPSISDPHLFRFVATNGNLLKLGLVNCNLSPSKLRELIHCISNTRCSLKALNISGNAFGSEGALALASFIEKNNSLSALCIFDNMIEEVGAIALGKAVAKNSSLLHLKLDNDRFLRLVACYQCFEADAIPRVPVMLLNPTDTSNPKVMELITTWQIYVDSRKPMPLFSRDIFCVEEIDKSLKRSRSPIAAINEESPPQI